MRLAPVVLSCAILAAAPAFAGNPADETLPPAAGVVALFEFDGNALDSSGNERHATLLGGQFVNTRLGTALRVEDAFVPMGIDWSAYAGLLVHPYTVEILFRPVELTEPPEGGYRKLFSSDDSLDAGWYYVDRDFNAYPTGPDLGEGQLQAGQLIYLAIVSTSEDEIEVFFNGRSIGTGPKGFTGTPPQAIFFQDDIDTGRDEQLNGDIEVLRISDVSRTAGEIATIAEPFPYFRDGFEAPGF